MKALIYPFRDIYMMHVVWTSCKRQGDHWLLGDKKSRLTPHENGSTSWNDQIGNYDRVAFSSGKTKETYSKKIKFF